MDSVIAWIESSEQIAETQRISNRTIPYCRVFSPDNSYRHINNRQIATTWRQNEKERANLVDTAHVFITVMQGRIATYVSHINFWPVREC